MKKLMIALAVGAMVLSMAGIGSAVTEINIYGASAQTTFWSSFAQAWIEDPAGGGCPANTTSFSPGNGKTYSPADAAPVYFHGAKYFIATNYNSTCIDSTGMIVRVAAYDSEDGVQSALGNANNMDVSGCPASERTLLKERPEGPPRPPRTSRAIP